MIGCSRRSVYYDRLPPTHHPPTSLLWWGCIRPPRTAPTLKATFRAACLRAFIFALVDLGVLVDCALMLFIFIGSGVRGDGQA